MNGVPLKVSCTAAREKNARSWSAAATPSTNTSDVSLISSTNSFVSGGIITRNAWGTMMLRIAWLRPIPSGRAASICPLGTASMPPRMVSARYAPATTDNPTAGVP